MKKFKDNNIFLLLTAAIIMLTGCSKPMDLYDEEAQTKINAVKLLGPIDSRHDWSTIYQGTVTVNANAGLDDIVKVQILTEPPFFNSDAKVLNEATAKKGDKVTIKYDAPKTSTQLVAACVSSKGAYYIQVFKPGDAEVNFVQAKSRVTRASGSEAPNITSIKLSAPTRRSMPCELRLERLASSTAPPIIYGQMALGPTTRCGSLLTATPSTMVGRWTPRRTEASSTVTSRDLKMVSWRTSKPLPRHSSTRNPTTSTPLTARRTISG